MLGNVACGEPIYADEERGVSVDFIDPTSYDIKVTELTKKWLKSKERQSLGDATMAKYRNGIRFINNSFKDKPVRKLYRSDVESFLDFLVEKNYSKNYIKDIKGTLSSILAYGVDEKMIYNNPCNKARVSRKVRSTNARGSFTPSELKQIEKYYKEIPFGYTVYTMLETGMRAQEICAIGKDSLVVKNKERFIYIYRAMKRTSNGAWIFGDPKSDNSFRYLPVSKKIYDHIATTILSNQHGLYLPRKDGQPISYTAFLDKYRAFFMELKKKADVRYLPPHCCRHTFSSSLEWEKVSPFVIRDLMGHSDVEMTNDYTHASDKERIAAIKKIG